MKKNVCLFVLLLAVVGWSSQFDGWQAAGIQELVYSNGFENPDLPGMTMEGTGKIVPGAGVNGNAGLVIAREDYPLERDNYVTLKLPECTPGIQYTVQVAVRQNGLKAIKPRQGFFAFISTESHYLDGTMVPWRLGTTHFMTKPPMEDFQTVRYKFTAREGMRHFLVLRLMNGWEGTLVYDDVKVFKEGIQCAILLTRPFAHTFYETDGKFMIHGDNLPDSCQVEAELFGSDGKLLKSLMMTLDEKGNACGDFGKKLPQGKAAVTLTAADVQKKLVFLKHSFPVNIWGKIDLPKNAVLVDEFDRMIVDGKPFLPIGISTSWDTYRLNPKRFADAGFNFFNHFGFLRTAERTPGKELEELLGRLDIMQANGMKLAVSTGIFHEHYRYRIKEMGGLKTMEEKTAYILKGLSAHPAVLFYYVSDEVPEEYLDDVVKMRNVCNSTDPYHPTMTLTNDPKLLPKFAWSGDIFCMDSYPLGRRSAGRDLLMIPEAMRPARRTGVPIWGYVQAFNWGYYNADCKTPEDYAQFHDPNSDEVLAMTLLFAIEGAKGFLFYADPYVTTTMEKCKLFGDPGYPDRNWENMIPAIQELKALEPYLLGTKSPPEVTVKDQGNSPVAARAFASDQGKTTILLVSRKDGKAEAVITVPGCTNLKSKFGKTKSLGNDRYQFSGEAIDYDVLYD